MHSADGVRFSAADRCPAETYQDILDRDTRPVPDSLRAQAAPVLGSAPVLASRYTDQAFFDQEVEKVWLKCWQMACREEDIPNVGDHVIYENVGRSLIIVRSAPDKIQALANYCMHRGRLLTTTGGCKNQFRCPYHGFAWNIDGSFAHNPFPWDFPHFLPGQDHTSLPEAKVGLWGGFVFVNFDPKAPPLESVLGVLADHFPRWLYQDKYKAVHVCKVVKANWKATAEAFMESHHVIATHPQLMGYLGDANSQYDVFSDHVTRQITASGVLSPHMDAAQFTEQDILESMRGAGTPLRVPAGQTARAFAAELLRRDLGAEDGHDYSPFSDAEMLDPVLYNLFPNMSFWAGAAPNLVYRWRPNGRDVNTALMDVIILKRCPKDKPRPRPAATTFLTEHQKWNEAAELGGLADIFEQDESNLPFVQRGMIGSPNNELQLGNYQEMRIGQLHLTIDAYLAR